MLSPFTYPEISCHLSCWIIDPVFGWSGAGVQRQHSSTQASAYIFPRLHWQVLAAGLSRPGDGAEGQGPSSSDNSCASSGDDSWLVAVPRRGCQRGGPCSGGGGGSDGGACGAGGCCFGGHDKTANGRGNEEGSEGAREHLCSALR